MHWDSCSRLAWPKAVTLLAASHPSEKRRAQAQEMARESDRERQTQASWTLVLSALPRPALQTRGRGEEGERDG